MDTYRTITQRRSIRRFRDQKISEKVLKRCINSARLSPTGANRQPLKFITRTQDLEAVFRHTNWAGYIDWEPDEEEMPRGYIAIIKKRDVGSDIDVGIAAQSICLTAWNEGIASCILGAIDRDELRGILCIPDDYDLPLLIALGHAAEESETIVSSDEIEYFREDGKTKVPKKPLKDVWIKKE